MINSSVYYENKFNDIDDEVYLEASDLLLESEADDIHYLIDNTDPKHIYFTSDWHLFKNHYKKEKNQVNTTEIISWCKNNIKDDDLFFYLGDISFRYANEKDKKDAQNIMKSIPGKKVLILGNHDIMAGSDFYLNCGFDFVFEELIHHSVIYTHRPVRVDKIPNVYLNIHGHIHDNKMYFTTDGSQNINVYPLFYNNHPVTLDYLIRHQDQLVKDNYWQPNDSFGESSLEETKRSNLPDSSFGIPEDRKFPLDSKKHVTSAIKLFGHASEDKKKSLAKRIASAAKRYSIKIPETSQVYKYMHESIKTLIPNEIDSCIFDMGSVLVGDCTKEMLYKNIHVPNKYVEFIYTFMGEKFFNSITEHMTLSQAKNYYVAEMSKINKDLIQYTDDIFECIRNGLYIYPYSYHMLDYLNNNGYKLYFLSNWELWSYELERDIFEPLLDKFIGGLFSFQVDCSKPDKEFYTRLLTRYSLDPKKCVFFDDKVENLTGSELSGIKAIPFNSRYTPSMIMESSDVSYPKDTILVNKNGELDQVNVSDIHWWYASESKNVGELTEDKYFKTLDDAISNIMNRSAEPELPEDKENNILYIFICNGIRQDIDDCFTPINVGIISVEPNREYTWDIQYPIEFNDGIFGGILPEENNTEELSEFSMAAMNPIAGIVKPYIIKVRKDQNTKVNPTQYLLSPDVVSDKYLAISEDGKLYIEDSHKFDDYIIESEYRYIGDTNIGKIAKAYYEGKVVDNTFFYTVLSNKPMLSEDQIDFDENFIKLDLDYIRAKTTTELATNKLIYENLISNTAQYFPVLNENINLRIYDKYKDSMKLELCRNIDGYFVKSNITGKITESVDNISDITNGMILSVMEV